jgi:hypothetical protein
MSTNGLTSWAVDLKDVGAIYPFQGTEFILVIAGLAFWIIWHIVQIRQEGQDLEHDINANPDGKLSGDAIDRY